MVSDTHKAELVHVEPREPQKMHPLVAAAMAHGQIDPATLRELLAVQREWEAGEARKAYTRALAALKGDMPVVIAHDATVDFTNKANVRTFYTHTSLAGALAAITPALTDHGFALSWTPRTLDRGVVEVTCRLTHTEGHFEEATLAAPADTSGNKSPAQGVASTITLLSRYSALALLGIATKDMKEPTGGGDEPDDDVVDVPRNMRAVAWFVKHGRTRAAAEAHVERGVGEWTTRDLAKLREWIATDETKNEAPADAGGERDGEEADR
jgi:hypothetical protein